MSDNESGKNILLSCGSGRSRVFAEAKYIGPDVMVMLWGGDSPHIGSVAVSVPCQRIAYPENIGATTSVHNFTGHRDDELSAILSGKIAAALNVRTVVTAGVHLNNITKDDISEIKKNTEEICCLLINRLGG